MKRLIDSLTYANVVATIAIFLAMGGAAFAVTKAAKNSVTSAAIKNGAVKGKDVKDDSLVGADIAANAVGSTKIADNAVGSTKIADNAVGSTKIADGTVGTADLAATEPFHTIGTPGEPQFFDGGEGDCVWTNGLFTNVQGAAPAGFAKDILGRVSLRGTITAGSGPGGDGKCDPNDPDEAEDGIVFVLPPGYRPDFLDVSLGQGLLVAPEAGGTLNGGTIPPGSVYSVLTANAVLDSVSFAASTTSPQTASAPAELSLEALRRLAR